jgi:hypothetical protein
VVTLPSGALLDRFSPKRTLIAGNVVNALGYGAWRLSTVLIAPPHLLGRYMSLYQL